MTENSYPVLRIYRGMDNNFLSHSETKSDANVAVYSLFEKKAFLSVNVSGIDSNDSNKEITGATVLVKDKKNIIEGNTISLLKGDKLIFEKEGFRDFIIPEEVTNSWKDSSVQDVKVYMDDDRKDGKPYVSSVYGAVNIDDKKYVYSNLFNDTLSIPKGKKCKIIVSAVGAGEGTEYYLTQDNKHKMKNETGIFEIDDYFTEFSELKKTYVYIRNADGTTSDLEEVKIDKGFANAAINKLLHSTSICLVGKEGQSIKIDDDIPIIGGLKMSLDGLKLPIDVEVEDCRIRISYGIDKDIYNRKYENGVKDKDSGWQLFKKKCQKVKEEKKKNTKFDLKKAMKEAGAKAKKGFSNRSLDWGLEGIGYAEGTIVDNKVVFTDVCLCINSEIGYEYIKYNLIYEIPCYLGIKVSDENSFEVKGVRVTDDQEVPLEFDSVLNINPSLEISYNAGLNKVASAGVYGKASLPFTCDLVNKHRTLEMDGELGLKGELWIFEKKKPIISGKRNIIDEYYGNALTTANCMQQFKSDVAQSENEDEDTSRDYINTMSEFDGTMINFSDQGELKCKELQKSIYSNGQCQLVKFSNSMMMVWVEDFKERDTYNRCRLVYSIYNCDDNSWSQPKAVSDNGKMDCNPTVVSDGQNVYIAWQNVNKILDKNDMQSYKNILDNTEIMYAKYDNEMDEFINITQVTDNNVYDYNPRINIVDGEPILYWIESSSDTYEKGSFTIMKTNENKTVESIYERLNYILDIECNDGEIAYIMDEDGTFDTCDDLNIYVNGNKIDSSDRAIIDCRYGILDGKETLFYTNGLNMFYIVDGKIINAFENEVSMDNDFEIINNANCTKLLWYKNSNTGTQLYLSNYENGKWTSPVEICDMNSNIKGMNVLSYNNQIYGIFDKTERCKTVGSEEREIYKDGLTDMCQFVLKDFSKLSADVIFVDDAQLVAGEKAEFDVLMENNGTKKINKIKFTITDTYGGKETLEKNVILQSGESKNINVSYTLPDNIENSKISIVATAIDENGDEGADDSTEYDIGKCDMLLKQLSVDEVEDCYIINGKVSNNSGVKAKNVFLHILPGSVENGKLDTLSIGDMEPHTDYGFSYIYEKSKVDFDKEGCYKFNINVATANDENIVDNNKQVVLVTKEKQKKDSKNDIDSEKNTTNELVTDDVTTDGENVTTAEFQTTDDKSTIEQITTSMADSTKEQETTTTMPIETKETKVTTSIGETTRESETMTSESLTDREVTTTHLREETASTIEDTTEPYTGEPATTEENTTNAPTEESTTKITDIEEPTTEPYTEEPTTERDTGEPATTEENTTNAPTEESTTKITDIEEPTTEPYTGEQTTDEEPTTDEETTTKPVVKKSQKLTVTKAYVKEDGAKAFGLNAKLKKGNGKITYSSSDKKVATVSSKGKVTVKGIGICTIIVQANETATYKKTVAKISITVKPKKNKISKLSVLSGKSLSVIWEKDTKVNGYELQYSTSKLFKAKDTALINIKKNTITSYKIKKLVKGKKYYVRIRAYKDVKASGKNKRLYGSYSSVRQSGKIK